MNGQQGNRKAELGQYMTPSHVAKFMASLFSDRPYERATLLDAGAGMGSLSHAFLERWRDGKLNLGSVEIAAFEIDPNLCVRLAHAFDDFKGNSKLSINFVFSDFLEHAFEMLKYNVSPKFTHCILNPPYHKLSSSSRHRALLRDAGVEIVNIYTAFIVLSLLLMQTGGQMVAIIPRSFCNGAYYKPFRRFLYSKTCIKHIHLFEARDSAFKSDGVLQENVIIVLERGIPQSSVTISSSLDDTFNNYSETDFEFSEIVSPNDPEQFIRIPNVGYKSSDDLSLTFTSTLKQLGVDVLTGPVVDFRLKEFLRQRPGQDTVPLLYPCHFERNGLRWPNFNSGKPNALVVSRSTTRWLLPNGCYVVIRRFTSKEEKKRLVANVIDKNQLNSPQIAFENHLNVIHDNKRGLNENLAYGLSMYLNSTYADNYFRLFSGHTQVNATDLRSMKFPSREQLVSLGSWAKERNPSNAAEIDLKISELL